MSRKRKAAAEPAIDPATGNPISQPDGLVGKPPETKEDRFRRLANRRVPNVLKSLVYVARLGNRAQYAYTPEQVATITGAIGDAFARVKDAFAAQSAAANGFRLE